MITIAQIEQDAMAAFKAVEAFVESDPNAKALVETAKATITTAKADALGVAADGLKAGIVDAMTPFMGADEAAVAAQAAVDLIKAHLPPMVTS